VDAYGSSLDLTCRPDPPDGRSGQHNREHDERLVLLRELRRSHPIVAAVGIFLHRTWGWALGILVAAGAFIGYIVSRTVGIFGLPPDVWMEPLGIASLVVEALFIAVALRAFTGSGQESPERAA
jgi:hypothetical protein